jgi:hypothetical protein
MIEYLGIVLQIITFGAYYRRSTRIIEDYRKSVKSQAMEENREEDNYITTREYFELNMLSRRIKWLRNLLVASYIFFALMILSLLGFIISNGDLIGSNWSAPFLALFSISLIMCIISWFVIEVAGYFQVS